MLPLFPAKLLGPIALVALLLSGCAGPINPSVIDAQWVSPEWHQKQKTLTSVLVTALSPNPTNRRIFEDVVCSTLQSRGIKAVPSYQLIPDERSLLTAQGTLNLTLLKKAAFRAGTLDLLVNELHGVQTSYRYEPGMTWGPGFGPGWPGYWDRGPWSNAWAIPPSISETQKAVMSTRLYNVETGNLLWTASTSTTLGLDNPAKTIELYGHLLIKNFEKYGLIPSPATSNPKRSSETILKTP